MIALKHQGELDKNGFCIIEDVFLTEELKLIETQVNSAEDSNPAFRKSKDLFAIRQFLQVIPGIPSLLFNLNLRKIITELLGEDYFLVKSIYFDKPPASNWFVAWDQDLTISVSERADISGFSHWTAKQGVIGTQPPVEILQENFTIRIHLDETTTDNGALFVLPGSHRHGIVRPETLTNSQEKEISCNVPAGGIMVMKPLLMHRSSRTTNQKQRRVIHLEFAKNTLPPGLEYAEKWVYAK